MNLKEVRTMLVDVSGRFDLVTNTTDYADNGANFFINAGMRWIEGKVEHPKSAARYVKDLTYGEFLVNMLYSRAIKEVWISNADGRKQLERKSLTWIRSRYSKDIIKLDSTITSGTLEVGSRYLITNYVDNDDFSNIGAESNATGVYFTATDTTPAEWSHGSSLRKLIYNISPGAPLYYAPCIVRVSPQVGSAVPPSTYDFDGIKFSHSASYNGILIMPPVEVDSTLTVLGDFMPADLSDDEDTNFWTERYPDILVQAAMFKIEQMYRNTEGAKDMERALLDALISIDYDNISGDVHDAETMERPTFYNSGNSNRYYKRGGV